MNLMLTMLVVFAYALQSKFITLKTNTENLKFVPEIVWMIIKFGA